MRSGALSDVAGGQKRKKTCGRKITDDVKYLQEWLSAAPPTNPAHTRTHSGCRTAAQSGESKATAAANTQRVPKGSGRQTPPENRAECACFKATGHSC